MAYLLIVDDDEDFADAVAIVLRDAGYEVEVELDTESGLESIRLRHPDLVILDVMFPKNSSGGFELARAMRHFNESLKSIPILILSAVNQKFPLYFSTHDIDDKWLPVDDFVEKPASFDIVLAKVHALVRRAG